MGISTFAHLVTDDEADVIKLCPDSVINKLCSALCKRGFLEVDDNGQPKEIDGPEVSVMATLYEMLAPSGGGSAKAGGQFPDRVYLEQASKFWSASISGMFVNVKFGKKGTPGQENSHSGPDARDYYEQKVNEKLRKGYKMKDPDAATKGAAMSALEKLTRTADEPPSAETEAASEPAAEEQEGLVVRRSKRRAGGSAGDAETVVPAPKKRGEKSAPKGVPKFPAESKGKGRVDLDKCGALVSFLLSKLTAVRIEDEDELLESVLRRRSAGSDVCYGPVALVSAEEVAKFAKILGDKGGVSSAKIEAVFDSTTFPDAVGALCNITKERELEYATTHALAFAGMLQHAVAHKCGLLIHFW